MYQFFNVWKCSVCLWRLQNQKKHFHKISRSIHQITIYPLNNVIHLSNNNSVGKQRNCQREFRGLSKKNATNNIPLSLTSSWTLDLSIRSNAPIIRVSSPSNDRTWKILRYLTYRAKQQIVCEQALIRVALTLSTQTLAYCSLSIPMILTRRICLTIKSFLNLQS